MNTVCPTCWAQGWEDSGSDAIQPQLCEDTVNTGFHPSTSSWSPGSLHQSLFQLIKLVITRNKTVGKKIRMIVGKVWSYQTQRGINIRYSKCWMTGTSLWWFSVRVCLCVCWNSSIMFFTEAPSLFNRSQNTRSMLYGSYGPKDDTESWVIQFLTCNGLTHIVAIV